MKAKAQTMEHFFAPNNPNPITGFLDTFEVACDRNRIREVAAMRLIPHYANETLQGRTQQKKVCPGRVLSYFRLSAQC